MAVITNDFTSLAALVTALQTAPSHLDLSAWRAPYEDFLAAIDDGRILFDGPGPNQGHVTGDGAGTFTMPASPPNLNPGTTITIEQVFYQPATGGNLQISGGFLTQPIKFVVNTGAFSGRVTQVGFTKDDQAVILFGNNGMPVTGTANFTVNFLSVQHGSTVLNVEGSVVINGNPLSPSYLAPVSGTITSIDLAIGTDHLVATGLSLPAVAFYNADTQAEIEAMVNLIFGGNKTLTADGDGQTLIGGGGNDTYDFGSFVPGTASELPNGGTDLVKVQHDYLLNDNIENATFTGAGDVHLEGNTLANKLTGGAGNDNLNGREGADTMIGGGGDDLYVADATGDKAVEAAGGGYDTLLAAATQTAGAEIENLSLLGAENINGTGNALANILTGNDGNNVLLGMAGADSITGGGGNDKLDGGDGADSIAGGSGANTLLGGGGNDTMVSGNTADSVDGGAGIDTVIYTVSGSVTAGAGTENLTFESGASSTGTGNALANVMTSGEGVDTLAGAGGNDTYNVQDGDTVLEAVGNGTDLVVSTTSFSLVAFDNVENLKLVGVSATTGTGTTMANVLTSDSGAHTLVGGVGNDTYNVQAGDFAIENADSAIGGVDLVNAFLSNEDLFDLAAAGTGIENLTLVALGAGAVSGSGNGLNNKIVGSTIAGANNNLAGEDGNDTLIGGAGNDTLEGCNGADSLVGGAGDDTYVFDFSDLTVTALDDAITDSGGSDTVAVLGSGDLSSVTLTLGAAIENFNGSGSVNINFKITGNAGNNRLEGSSLADTFIGGAGNDYYVKGVFDVVTEIAGGGTMDVIEILGGDGGNADIAFYQANIEGLVLNDNVAGTVLGTVKGDFLGSKGLGLHTLQGGLGNDTYSVHVLGINSMDSILGEDTGQGGVGGTDLVIANLANMQEFTLLAGLENLTLVNVTGPGAGMIAQGNALANKITGAVNATQTIDGLAGNDTIIGGAYDDMLIGSAGADSLVGGLGNDTFVVLLKALAVGALEDSFSDTGGIDTLIVDDQGVATSFIYPLLAALENIDISAVDSVINAKITGNAANNIITGNGGNNTLDGAAGNDSIFGGDGSDSMLGGAGADTLAGGFLGADTLDGGLGDDLYIEQDGDDTFLVAQAGDTINVGENGGIDTVIVGATGNTAYLNITGGNSFLDNVTFTGTVGVAITGNGVDNLLKGGSGADTFDGGLGGDTLVGGAGNDYYIMAANDTITELAAGGTADTVESRMTTYGLLNTNVERLVLGAGALNGVGNTLANVITGNGSDNSLVGGLGGADTMTGGAGADTFVLDGIATGRVVTILDYVGGVDHIALDMNVTDFADLFTGADLGLGAFSAGSAPLGANPQLFYNTTTGKLYYDDNGAIAGMQTLIAVFAPDHRPDAVQLEQDIVQFNGFA